MSIKQQNLIQPNHYDLCRLTAERFFKESDVVLYEYNYNLMGSTEMPDVLCFKSGHTTLYEIKVSIKDFRADQNKESRIKFKNKYYLTYRSINGKRKPVWIHANQYKVNQEFPHLGRERYYVCPAGMIQPNEVERWGLYWIKNNRFYLKKKSELFARNIHLEIKILTHAMRKFASLDDTNILVNTYR